MQAKAGLPVHFSKLILLGLLGLLFLAGCSSVQGYQKALDFKDYLPAKPDCVNESTPVNKECRNKFIDWYIVQSSINFSAFVRNLTKDRNASGLIIDNLRTGLEMAIVVVTGAGPKTALGATAGGLGALQGSIDKRLFYEKTVPALVKFMDAKRSLILAEILEGRSQKIDRYPFSLAIRDLQRFNDAGSISDAITSVAAEGAKQAKEADTVVRDLKFVEKRAQDEVEKLLEKADLLPSGKAWEILQNLPSELDDFTKSKVEEELGETQLSAAEGMLGGAENDANAKTILKLILSTLEDRTEENLAKWAAAMNSEQ